MDDTIKQKNMLMSSIMKNPKLAKQFREAMQSKIGSTKREHIKSTLSIMKKVGGVKNDGMGGPILGGSFNPNQGAIPISQPSAPKTSNYNNMMVFPAAPKLKTTNVPGLSNNGISLNQTPSPSSNNNTSDYGISGNALQNVNLPSVNYGSPTVVPKYIPPVVAPKSIDYAEEVKKYPEYPGYKIFRPDNIEAGSKSVVQGVGNFLGGIVKPIGAGLLTAAAAPAATLLGGTAFIESLLTPGAKQTAPGDTYTGNLARTIMSDSPWVKYLSGLGQDNSTPSQTTPPATTSTTPPITTPSTTTPPTGGTPTPTSLIQPNGSPATISQTGSTTPGTFNIAATNIAKMLGTTPNAPLTQIPVINFAGAVATNEGYFNGTSQVAIKNNNPGNLKFANQPGATQGENGFAVFQTADEGAQALINDIQAKYNSGKYSTINDLMSVYSPDSDNPANSSYTGGINTGGTFTGAPSSGPYAYASAQAKAAFGGRNITQVATDNYAEYLKSVEPLELELSKLKTEAPNFVSTLTTYMAGRDKNSKAIDAMIEQTAKEFATANMADPYTANYYNNTLNYLYGLKGRQNQRYTTYLNSRITDFNAEVINLENKVTAFKTNATNALNQKNAIDQATYNDIMTLSTEAWNTMDGAEAKAYNMGIIKQNYYAAGGDAVANGFAANNATNSKLQEDKNKWLKDLAINGGQADPETGSLDTAKIPAGGLINLYELNGPAGMGSDQRGLTWALNEVFSQTIKASGNDPKKVAEIQKLITQLRDSAGGYNAEGKAEIEKYANSLSDGIAGPASTSYSGYIQTHLAAIKQATKDLVSGYGGWGFGWGKAQAGIQDKEKWKADHSSLDSSFLENLYNTVNKIVGADPAYTANPMSYINDVFSGTTDQLISDRLASDMSTS